MMNDDRRKKYAEIFRLMMKVLIYILIIIGLFFGSAGTFYWIEAWLLILLFLLYVTFFTIWLKRNNPELLKERRSRKKGAKSWDRIILSIYSILLIFMFIVCGFDAVRFKWSMVPFMLKIFGFLGYIPVILLIFFTFRENTFLSRVVRIQDDRAHQVVKTGPYNYIRHPMYLAIIFLVIFTPLALGSFFALILSALIIMLFVIRTYLEDKTLQEELPGYKEYTDEVRCRLFPGIW